MTAEPERPDPAALPLLPAFGWPRMSPMPWLIVLALNGLAISVHQTPLIRVEALSQWMTPLTSARSEFLIEQAWTGVRAGEQDLERLQQRLASLRLPELQLSPEGYALRIVVREHAGGWMRWRYLDALDSPVARWSCAPTANAPADELPREWLPPICWTQP